MKTTSIRRAIVPGIAVIALALSGCAAGNESGDGGTDAGSGSSDSTSSESDSTSSEGGSFSGTLNGGGASSQESAQGIWRAGFQGDNSGVTVNYDPVGSGTGRENFISGAYSFAGSDSALSSDEGEIEAANTRCGGDVIEVPAYVSPIAVVYNLPGIEGVQLDAATTAAIFDDKITTWDDAAIADLNPDLDLPSTTITPVHRSDDSGTTNNFTDYLSKAADGGWSYEADGVWPKQGGEAAEGTSGLVAAVKAGEGTIGYADESQAGGLGIAAIKVGEEYVTPSAQAAAKVVAVSPRAEDRGANDMAISVDRTTTEAGAYPLILLSYLIACPTYEDSNEAALVKGFMTYVISEAGQQAAADQAGSAPLDPALSEEASAIIETIS